MENRPIAILPRVPNSARKHALGSSALENRSKHNGNIHADPFRSLTGSPKLCLPPQKRAASPLKREQEQEDQENNPPSLTTQPTNKKRLAFVHETFITSPTRTEKTRDHRRPSTGGKTVSSVKSPAMHYYHRHKKQRMSPEQLQMLSRRIDPTEKMASPHQSPCKPALPILYSPSSRKAMLHHSHHHHHHHHASRSSMRHSPEITQQSPPQPSPLFKTCHAIWPNHDEQQQLKDMSHDTVKNLSELLKVRLSQAKFRVLAALEESGDHSNLYAHLKADTCENETWPIELKRPPIKLPTKRAHSPLITVGNGRNMFTRPKHHRRRKYNKRRILTPASDSSPTTMKRTGPVLRKQRMSTTTMSPTRLDDGSTVYLCEPCNKRYKNRNGLAYHIKRCKFAEEETVYCSHCSASNDEGGTMVQCDDCLGWLHLSCLGLQETDLDETYTCARCNTPVDEEDTTKYKDEDVEEGEDEQATVPDDTSFIKMQDAEIDADTLAASTAAAAAAVAATAGTTVVAPDVGEFWNNFQQTWALDETPNLESSPFHGWPNASDLSLPSLLLSDNGNQTLGGSGVFEDDLGAITPTTSAAASPVNQDAWFEFANFEDDFHCQ
ncbi:hypothetical protein BCR43DRAFT_498602 [Syncephalastrum racemosum]|uniref:PHD-type domain-containing protein n=1 Tax=Syncephalastrum racemosum TaxID=13706 RepID=A0A1X2H1D6_SYNRA|nr:hypothetical protein BCR43DRAFT_498602 [Syncephalastrum racemosum]